MTYKPFCTSRTECHGSLVKVSSAVGFPVKCHAGQVLVVDVYIVAVKGLGE